MQHAIHEDLDFTKEEMAKREFSEYDFNYSFSNSNGPVFGEGSSRPDSLTVMVRFFREGHNIHLPMRN